MKLGLLFTVWLIAAIAGFGYTMGWGFSPGKAAHASRPDVIQGGTQIQAIIHPLCPCSGASLDLLKQAISESGSKPDVEIIFSGDAQQTKNVEAANSIPGARVTFASEEEITKRFGPATSGHMFIWRNDKLALSGGITDARGEKAKGAAFDQFKLALESNPKIIAKTLPTYGCPVQGGR